MGGKICHITTAHAANDDRIYIKECTSLSQEGYEVFLIAPETSMPLTDVPVNIKFIPKEYSRFLRLIRGQWHALKEALKLKASLYHFHDPELVFMGLVLKFMGEKVIYDVHEDLPRQILTKEWLPSWSRKIIASIAELVEWIGAKFFDGIITVTPLIQKRFPPHKTILIQNFPILGELASMEETENHANHSSSFAYIGGITATRGIIEMVKALEYIENFQVNLTLAGNFSSENLYEEIKSYKGWEKVQYEGFVSRDKIAKILGEAKAGLVVLHPIRNYIDAYPVKLFEYMSTGIPVIASDFPLWRQIIEDAQCGLLVNPLCPKEIAEAMKWILEHPNEAEKMGQNGLKAVQNTYNWENESKKLLGLYQKLLQKKI
ncbi:glycosyltransferase family 4 protein [Aminobacterium sp. UBA5514]|uniref:glycosyltransferase family 4 protein n=1 Tax=Aminobacterium sp. UBA5514 TaxID=1946036 RepID=UPI00257D5589|nr:glycosyltransferase family 4 protein [Aminobacterium sp. UBA5514]